MDGGEESVSLDSLLQLAVATAATGESQNFLGARWVEVSLDYVPRNWKRPLALRFLSASPHYFFRTKENRHLSTSDFLESEYQRNRRSRQLIIDNLVASRVRPDFVCLDFGCGPGFLAAAVAPKVTKVVACDISGGVISCARIVNPAPNIDYRKIGKGGRIPAEDASVDLIYTFAVIQHVTDDVLRSILAEFQRVLKPGALVVCHITLDREGWKTESTWRADKSLKGRVKWQIGMHCFARSPESYEQMIERAGLKLVELTPISAMKIDLASDDVEGQHLSIINR
jgi:ubiquinone/menaquinone biosynthesis C-methylase UbiE